MVFARRRPIAYSYSVAAILLLPLGCTDAVTETDAPASESSSDDDSAPGSTTVADASSTDDESAGEGTGDGSSGTTASSSTATASGSDSEGEAPTAPEGEELPCPPVTLPFEYDPAIDAMDPRNTYWAMWFSYWSQVADDALVADVLAGLELDRHRSFSVPSTGLQGFVAGGDALVVVAFRGSEEILDWLANFNFPQRSAASYGFAGRVHQGFASTLDSGWSEIVGAVEEFGGSDRPVLVTGHSLGGSLATLAAARLSHGGYDVAPVYTFGNPRVGDVDFADQAWQVLQGRAYRFVNRRDVVPRLPPAGIAASAAAPVLPAGAGLAEDLIADMQYAHIGTMYWFTADGLVAFDPMDDSEDIDYWTAMGDWGWTSIIASQASVHDPDAYLCLTRALAYGY